MDKKEFDKYVYLCSCSKCNLLVNCVNYNEEKNKILKHPLDDFSDLYKPICWICYNKIPHTWIDEGEKILHENHFNIDKGMTTKDNKLFFKTWLGHEIYPDHLQECIFDIRDIAHASSIVRRYGGHTNKGISSGQHALLVEKYTPQPHKFRSLLHDASDAYSNDLVSALKYSKRMAGYLEIESEIQRIIYERFGLGTVYPSEEYEIVKRWDMAALAAEARCLTNHDWWQKIPESNLISENVVPIPDDEVEHLFLRRFDQLYKERQNNEKAISDGNRYLNYGSDC